MEDYEKTRVINKIWDTIRSNGLEILATEDIDLLSYDDAKALLTRLEEQVKDNKTTCASSVIWY